MVEKNPQQAEEHYLQQAEERRDYYLQQAEERRDCYPQQAEERRDYSLIEVLAKTVAFFLATAKKLLNP